MTARAPDIARPEGLEAVLHVTRSAARDAAALACGGFRKRGSILAVEHKGAVDLVTKYDRESEALLRRRLFQAFPDFAIVGEEEGGAAPSAEQGGIAFYVDPIDGTTNFVHGHPFWCISIGLVISGLPVLGVVISPPLGLELSGWVAASGEKRVVRRAASNKIVSSTSSSDEVREESCVVSATSEFEEAMLATGFPYDRRTSDDDNFDAFFAIKKKCQAVRRCGSAALDLCLVADGTYDGYWEKKVRPWDIAAGIAIVRAAGGHVTDFDGGSDFFGKSQVVATNGAVHARLLTELANVRANTHTR